MGAGGETKGLILFVDDSKLMRRAAERCLAGHYDVLLAADGAEALEFLDRRPEVRAVITDLCMPEMDGRKLLEAIRGSEDQKRRAMPVMVATGSTADENLAAVREAGADGVITKPFKADALLGRLQQLLEGPSMQSEAPAESVGDSTPAAKKPSSPPTCIEPNAERLQQRLRQALALHTRHGLPLSIMQLQVENIDDVTSEFGRKAASSVMRYVQKILGEILRDEDSCGPCSPDAFTLVLPITEADGARALAGRLEQAFSRRTLKIRKQPLDLQIKLVLRDLDMSPEDIEMLAAGMDRPTTKDNVVEIRIPRSKAPVDPQASSARPDPVRSAAASA